MTVDSFDRGLEGLLNGLAGRNDVLDALIKVAALDLVYLIVPLLLLLWFWRSPTQALRQRLVGAIVVAVALAYAGGVLARALHGESRPFVVDPSVRLLIPHAPDDSFPSDHGLLAFAVAGALLWWRRAIGLAALAVGAVAGFARVVAGVHWPIDIIGSAVIGIAAGAVGALTAGWWARPQRVASRVLPAWLVAPPEPADERARDEVAARASSGRN